MFRRLAVLGLAFAAAALFASVRPARAATAQNNLTVTANVIGVCSIGAALLDFDDYDGMENNKIALVPVTCNGANVPFWIDLDDGADNRQMQNGAARLPYQLARDANQTAPWGVGDPGTPDGITSGNVQIFGRITAGHVVPQGVYTDTVVMTINF
jgi:spore coat protein U-like protein